MSAIPQEWVDAFAEGWHSVPPGTAGDRRRAGLAAALPLIREAIAREIERLDWAGRSERALAYGQAIDEAARIARGGAL